MADLIVPIELGGGLCDPTPACNLGTNSQYTTEALAYSSSD
jgi:hypothetical protein